MKYPKAIDCCDNYEGQMEALDGPTLLSFSDEKNYKSSSKQREPSGTKRKVNQNAARRKRYSKPKLRPTET